MDPPGADDWGGRREYYLSSTFRVVASCRTKSSGAPFLMSGREKLPSSRFDACTREPNNKTASARSPALHAGARPRILRQIPVYPLARESRCCYS